MMSEYRRLLVATDGSDRASAAAEQAIALAKATGASLAFLFVIDVRPVYSRYGLAALPSQDEIESERNRGESIVGGHETDAADAGVDAEGIVVRGTPHLLITSMANDVDADAIVIGAPRPRTFSRVLGVSTTDRVVRNADCSVIVAREGDRT